MHDHEEQDAETRSSETGAQPPGNGSLNLRPQQPSRAARLRRRLGWLRFLKPNNPAEALALIGVGVAIGTGGGKVFDAITAQDPWSERADRVCLRRGDEYLSLGGPRLERLRGQIRVTAAALSELSEIRSSVPTESALAYNGLLADKAGVLRALREELTLAKMRKPTAPAVEQRRERQAAYEQDALGLGLAVCGQGTGEQ